MLQFVKLRVFVSLLFVVGGPPAALAGEAYSTPPVYAGELTRPYEVVGEICDNLRKHFAFQADPSKEKIYAEIWERARKMGADAVINARFGPTEKTPFNHGRTAISGIAIRFTDKSAPDK